MPKEPTIGKFLDAEEEELYRAIEFVNYEFGESFLIPGRMAELRQAARNTLNDERIQLNLRLPT